MVRGLFIDSTDYSYQSLTDVKTDLKGWIADLNKTIEQLHYSQNKLIENGYWYSKVDSDLQKLFAYATRFYHTGREELKNILSEMEIQIQEHHVQRIHSLAERANELNHRYGQVWHQKLRLHDSGFGTLEMMYTEGRDTAIDMVDLSNLGERLQGFVGQI